MLKYPALLRSIGVISFISLGLPLAMPAQTQIQSRVKTLKVSADRHSLVFSDGTPFFYLADTAWELFHRLNREQADQYLTDRAHKGFTVIQAVALAELDGLKDPNAYGHRPLVGNDPTKPDVKAGAENDYWDNVDYIINKAEKLGLYVGLLPTWGDKWNKSFGTGPEIFTPENARTYGKWLGQRYSDKPIIWILGGDRPVETPKQREIIVALAAGLKAGDGGAHLITFHPPGANGSSTFFPDAGWLDFNMRQNGHGADYKEYGKTLSDYERSPAKPIVDGEPIYEDHPISFKPAENGYSVAADMRRAIYWDLFNGACGFAYGNHAVWQMYSLAHPPINAPLMSWEQALQEPGSAEVQYARWLFLSRPFLSRVPDPSLIISQNPTSAMPGAGRARFVGIRDQDGSDAMVYAPVGRRFSVRMDKVTGPSLHAWWYDPRTGHAQSIGEFPATGVHEFMPPSPGEYLDWILVLDSTSRSFPPPGTH